jgi:ELWxxDGT repeat protein
MLLGLLLATQVALTPTLVKDMAPEKVPQESTFNFESGRMVGNLLFFGANGAEPGLWCTDGTEAGTYRVYDGLLRHQADGIGTVSAAGAAVYSSIVSSQQMQLVTSDGTTPGTRAITPISAWYGGAPCGEGKVCFVGGNNEIGVTDGTAEGTTTLLQTSRDPSGVAWALGMTALGKRAFFNGKDEDAGQCMRQDSFVKVTCGDLWVSDGTVAGTHLFKDLNPGGWPSTPSFFFASKSGKLYFQAYTPYDYSLQATRLVWASDGTPEGTGPLDPQDRFFVTNGTPFIETRGHVYYMGGNGSVRQTDGTPESTQSIWRPQGTDVSQFAIDLGAAGDAVIIVTGGGLWSWRGGEPVHLVDGNVRLVGNLAPTGLAYFARSGDLWSTDGTVAGTRKLFRLLQAGTSVAVGSTPRRFFWRDEALNLFGSDGTESGTGQIDTTTFTSASSSPRGFFPFGDKLFFVTDQPRHRFNVSDGTAAGTFPLADVDDPSVFVHEGRVYYNDHYVLSTTDGTAAGTRRVSDWLGSPGVRYPPSFIGQTAIFGAAGATDEVLMRRDADGTLTKLDVHGTLREFAAAGDRVAFWQEGQGGNALMITDGTNEGTKRVTGVLQARGWLMPFGNGGFFGEWTSEGGFVLWWTDFTEAGTHVLKTLSTQYSDQIKLVTTWQGAAIFLAGNFDPSYDTGQIVWRSDGTPEGTFPLSDQRFHYVVADGAALTLVRRAYDADNVLGWEIWTSDGTAAGTRLRTSGKGIVISAPFAHPSGEPAIAITNRVAADHLEVRTTRTNSVTPIDLGVLQVYAGAYANGRLYLAGCRTATGCELWGVPLSGESARLSDAKVQIVYRGTASTAAGRAAVFRVHMETTGTTQPAVVATTVDGTLTAAKDYVPFTKTIVFDDDRDVTLVVPLRSDDARGTMSVILSSPTNATIEQGIATAAIGDRRRAVLH